VLVVAMVVLMFVMVVEKAARLDICERAKIANPSLMPIPE
jgi:hypothetical protein